VEPTPKDEIIKRVEFEEFKEKNQYFSGKITKEQVSRTTITNQLLVYYRSGYNLHLNFQLFAPNKGI
jgi:hypothetical protein